MNKNAMLIPGEAEAGDVLRFPGRTGGHVATLTAVLGFFPRTPLSSAKDFTSTKSRIIQLCLELTSTVQKVSETQTAPEFRLWDASHDQRGDRKSHVKPLRLG